MKKILTAMVWVLLLAACVSSDIFAFAKLSAPFERWAFQKTTPYEESVAIWLPAKYAHKTHKEVNDLIDQTKVLTTKEIKDINMETFKAIANRLEVFVSFINRDDEVLVIYTGFGPQTIPQVHDSVASQRPRTGDLYPVVTIDNGLAHVSWKPATDSYEAIRMIVGIIIGIVALWLAFVVMKWLYQLLFEGWKPWDGNLSFKRLIGKTATEKAAQV